MTAVEPRCSAVVHWWDLDTDAPCVNQEGHRGHHRDGTRWFDNDGLQVPTERGPSAHSATAAGGRDRNGTRAVVDRFPARMRVRRGAA